MIITANARLITFLSVLAALFAVAVLSYNVGTDDRSLEDRILHECESLPVGENTGHTDDYTALLRSAGYFGKVEDGEERLYSPGCRN